MGTSSDSRLACEGPWGWTAEDFQKKEKTCVPAMRAGSLSGGWLSEGQRRTGTAARASSSARPKPAPRWTDTRRAAGSPVVPGVQS